ncbi:hypothetical protein AVEN_211372-1 [Araneus ventricosus]|uniref:Uncharacterized protein n=1 Tax=Araneus ventricosus TaxID=182803 RepID=A0A4Y2U3M1_ARAVE|nr:hypothetical protein AVEN_211372-1 [Araneus ventricosus]
MEFKRTQNPGLHEPIPIRDPDARLATHQWICLHWNLASRLENRKSAKWWGDRRATVAHFGAYVNDVRNFSIKMGGKKGSRTSGIARPSSECPA